ncbi:MAG TPA: FAD-dependent oxidoreductase [Bryobacteraceae bacterium]|nr:FAD-dependent oxidoreductase [Bryobacteraceae bacterium]
MGAPVPDEFATDVLICGAGAAGLTLAIDLARRGVAFRVIDMAEGPFQGSRGKGLQPRTLEVFEDLGIVDRVFARGGFYPLRRQYGDSGFRDLEIFERREPSPAEPYSRPLMLPQNLTEAVMRERLAEFGQRVEFGRELTGIAQDAGGVVARVAGANGEETIRVRYLVGADGGRSFVRKALDIGFPGETMNIRAVVADLALEGLTRDVWHWWSPTPGAMMTLCPLCGTDLFQLQAPIPMEGDPDLSAEGLTAMISQRTGRQDIIVREVSWCSAYSMNARLADRFHVGRIFLAGDAAHIHPPTGGQGLNTSVQDAYNLGWKLAAVLNGAPEKLLATYEEERRPVAASVLGLSAKLLEATGRGEIRRGRDAQEMDLSYPSSTLSLERPARTTGVHAGDRAPDAPCRSAAGYPTRLFNLFHGPHWTLLGYEVDRAAVPLCTSMARPNLRIHCTGASGDIVDEGGHIRAGYGVQPGDWVLIRPDGYIGAMVGSDEIPALARYLDDAGLRAMDRAAVIRR